MVFRMMHPLCKHLLSTAILFSGFASLALAQGEIYKSEYYQEKEFIPQSKAEILPDQPHIIVESPRPGGRTRKLSESPYQTTPATSGLESIAVDSQLPGDSLIPLESEPVPVGMEEHQGGVLESPLMFSGEWTSPAAVLSPNMFGANIPGRTSFVVFPIPGQVFAPGPVAAVNINNPTNGGGVGRTLIAEDSSPLPRDRFIFNYDFFNNVPLTVAGWDVNRFTFGFEKTFFQERASFELRIPFASTLDSGFIIGSPSDTGEFGNLRLSLKGLFYKSNSFNSSAGLALSIPTGNDTRVFLPNGTELAKIDNEAFLITPFLAGLWTPNDRFFAQGWLAFDFDAAGNTTYANVNQQGLIRVGELDSQVLMQLDFQAGYWLCRRGNQGPVLRGFAPFVELHYNTSLNDSDIIRFNGFVIGDTLNEYEELNVTTGCVAQIGDNLNLSLGLVFPLLESPDRSFDYQLGFRANLFLGHTAVSRRVFNYLQGAR